MRIEIYKEFTFEAAHRLLIGNAKNKNYKNIHGHSFYVQIFVKGKPNSKTGWIEDFSYLDKQIKPIKEALDHKFLNDITGLENPTLETLSNWIWNKLKPKVKGLNKIKIKRGSCGEGCTLEK